MKIDSKSWRPIPSPVALVTCCVPGGKANIITLGEVFNVSIDDPVIVGIAIRPGRYSNELIRLQGEFVVNLATADMTHQCDQAGAVSGRDVDKFKLTGLTPIPAKLVEPPLIAESPLNLECRMISVTTVGDHDLFLGEVVAQHVDEAISDDKGQPDQAKLNPLLFFGRSYFSAGSPIGRHGQSRRK